MREGVILIVKANFILNEKLFWDRELASKEYFHTFKEKECYIVQQTNSKENHLGVKLQEKTTKNCKWFSLPDLERSRGKWKIEKRSNVFAILY